ncbi:MAG: metallophosphoesterase [Clostridia bacterium]|nr:metallophosphoesterase [Clostridia bacterium]
MIFVTSDLHGYPLSKFRKLLLKAGFGADDELYVLGDVVDRHGDGGVETLLWMMEQPNVTLLLGNHEGMLLACDFLFETVEEDSIEKITYEQMNALAHWMRNGAEPTMASLRALHEKDPEQLYDLLDYLRDAPLFEALTAGGRDYILTHAGLGGFSPDKKLWQYTADELIWYRPKAGERYFDEITVVFGHTPTDYVEGGEAGRMLRTDTWIDIDTGAAGDGAPMVLRLDDLTPFYIGGE